jgi:HAE1 family hydrophobic/amphiphilic exporter-1
MLMLMVVVLGLFSFFSMPRDLTPKIEFPMALVLCTYENAAPQEVESLVTKPLETALASVEGLEAMYSITLQGQSIVALQFEMRQDMNFATLNMREKIALVEDFLPDTAGDPMVLKLDMNALPISQVYVSADLPLEELYRIVDDTVVAQFERLSGVASVDVTGGITEEIHLELDPEKLSSYGLNLAVLSQLLATENINMPSGDMKRGSREVIVRTVGEFQSINDIQELPLMLPDSSILRLGDLATITEGTKDTDSITRIDGKTAIGMMVTKQSDANTVEVSDRVRALMKDLEKEHPELQFNVGFDQADFINSSLKWVGQAAIAGAILAVFVVFLFLLNIRSTLVIAVSIPTSILATFAIMNWQGITLNLFTLASLTIAVGMLVDNSIVVLENIFRIRQTTSDPQEASFRGSKEVLLAVAASSVTTMLVFLPIALSDGLAGLLFRDFCITIVIALAASLLVSVTVVPMLCSKLLTRGISTQYIRFGEKRYKFKQIHKFNRGIQSLTQWYEVLVKAALKRKKRVILVCFASFLLSLTLILVVGTELLPAADEGVFNVEVDTPYGTTLEQRDVLISQLEEYILTLPETQHLTVNIGGNATSSFGQGGSDSLSVVLVSPQSRKRTTEEIARDVERTFASMAGADINARAVSTFSDMMGGGVDMSLMIKGPDLKTLEEIGQDLIHQIESTEGVAEASLDLEEGTPELRITLDRKAASYYGVTAYQLANGLHGALSGTTATTLKVDGRERDVTLSFPPQYRLSLENLKQIPIPGTMGFSVPVGQIATFEYDNSPNSINRMDQERYITLNIDIEGSDLGKVSKRVHRIGDNYPLPYGYTIETGGNEAEMVDAFQQLFKALIIAILLVYLILAAQFESLLMPFVVAMSIPFAMTGSFLALFFTGAALSLVSFLGMILLVGIVVNNSILLVEFINRNRESMSRDSALVEAGKIRFRPILMTTTTTVVGMIPMALGIGEGGEIMAPMAISIIGGLITSTLVTLILTPVLYGSIDDRKSLRLEKRHLKNIHLDGLEEKWKREDQNE